MKFFLKNQGVITAFVTMIMVPVVVFTGIFVDISRFKFCSSQAIMAADAYAEGVLGTYDNVLRELYGLFSITQNEEALSSIDDIEKYVACSFNPGKETGFKKELDLEEFVVGGEKVEGSMPYANVEVDLEYEPIEGANLKNSSVFLTQVADFMQYRIVGEMIEDSGILDAFAGIKNVGKDSEAMEKVSEIGKRSTKVLKNIETFYKNFVKINEYPTYQATMELKYSAYTDKLVDLVRSDNYIDYYFYYHHRDEIEKAVIDRQNYYNAKNIYEANNPGKIYPEELSATTEYLAGKEGHGNLINDIISEMENAKEIALDYKFGVIHFDNTGDFISNLKDSSEKVEKYVEDLEKDVQSLKTDLESCSEELREGMQEDIKELEKVTELKGRFSHTYNHIDIEQADTQKNNNNKQSYINKVNSLDYVKSELRNATIAPDAYIEWDRNIELDWGNFQEDVESKKLYDELVKMYERQTATVGDKKAGDKISDDMEKLCESEKKSIDDEDKEEAPKDIGDNLASQLNGVKNGEVGEIGFVGASTLSEAFNMVIDKFLLASYNFGMFSSRVTGIEKPKEDDEENNKPDSSLEEEYADYSLTKVKMSPDVNYLYRAELEYLFGGHTKSKKNWNAARNTICTIRMPFNFASTYTIPAINNKVKIIANTAASAVASSGVGAAVAPIVRVAVSAAVRSAIAGMETAAEWKQLKAREKVLLYKRKAGDMECFQRLGEIIDMDGVSDEKSDDGIRLSYEDYLYLLMLLTVNTEDLTSRTADLITLNVNQSQNDGDTLTTLDFNMANTVTAIESTCKVKMDFVVVPDNFANMFISGTSTETTIKSLEDTYTGFTLIRGY